MLLIDAVYALLFCPVIDLGNEAFSLSALSLIHSNGLKCTSVPPLLEEGSRKSLEIF